MPRPTVRPAILLALTVLAGCADEPEEPTAVAPPAAGAASGGAPARVGLEPCEETAAIWPIAGDEARRFVPDGFTPRGVVGPGTDGTLPALQLITALCRPDAQTQLGSDSVGIATAWILVEPPTRWRVDGIQDYAIAPWTLVTDPDAAALLQVWGLPTEAGDVAFTPLATPVLRVDTVEMADGAFRATMTVESPARSTHPTHAPLRIFTFTQGEVSGAIDLDTGSHPHWEYGEARLVVTQGEPPFPRPWGSGVGVHGFAGPLIFTRVPFEHIHDPVVHE